jgi:hypothetical protein
MVRYLEDETQIGDTLTTTDAVIKQYERLPYPNVNEHKLLFEVEFYKKYQHIPLVLYESHTLEKLNHYLYRGNQNFR